MFNFKVDDRIELRTFMENDAEAILQLVKRNYEHLRPFLHWVNTDYSLETAREFTRRAEKAPNDESGQTFGIVENGNLIGAIGFVLFNRQSRRTEIGYWIGKDFEGKGIVSKCCRVLIDYAFRELEMNRIEIHCATENVKSRRIPEKLGFKLDGVLRQSEWRHTRFFDMAIYSLLADEYEKSKKKDKR